MDHPIPSIGPICPDGSLPVPTIKVVKRSYASVIHMTCISHDSHSTVSGVSGKVQLGQDWIYI